MFRILVTAAAISVAVEGLAMEMVEFPSADADLTRAAPTRLAGWLMKPAGGGPFPAIVLLHGCSGLYAGSSGERLSARHAEWSERLRDEGYVVLLPDSFNPRGHRQICTLKDRPILATRERTRDAFGALFYLQSRSFVRADRIAIMGWSHGGQTTLATITPHAPGLPAAFPQGDFRAAVAFYPGCTTARREGYGARAATLILVGEADDWTPAAPCLAMAEAARGRGQAMSIVAYPGAYHDFDAPDVAVRLRTGLAIPGGGTSAHIGTDPAARADAFRRVPDFLARHLKE
jgi:dienelactone hydrolase